MTYYLFAGECYYPGGGMSDLVGEFDDIPSAVKKAEDDENRYGWYEIASKEPFKTVFSKESRWDEKTAKKIWVGGNLVVEANLRKIRQFYNMSACGGSLHIILDDGNLEDRHIKWCINFAKEQNDPEAIEIAEILLKMTMEQREEVYKSL